MGKQQPTQRFRAELVRPWESVKATVMTGRQGYILVQKCPSGKRVTPFQGSGEVAFTCDGFQPFINISA